MTQVNRRHFLGMSAAAAYTSVAAGAGKHPHPWSGVFIIMQTPFLNDSAKSIDEESLRKESDFLVRCGVHGVVWPAGAGETAALSVDERLRYSGTIVKEVRGRTPVMIGVHGRNIDEAVAFAKHAEKIGADAMVALPPTAGKQSEQSLTEYFTAITKASKLPLCIQVMMPPEIDPQVNAPLFSVDYLIGLARKLPTFRYVKEEIRPVPHRIDRYVREAKGLLTPMTGGGSRNLLNEIARGSRGTMPGAGFADIQAKIWDWYVEGKKKDARDLFGKMLMMAVLELHTGYVLQKEILRRRGVFRTAVMRVDRGFAPMDAGDQRELDEVYEALRPYFRV
jgi:4-hydroxy-tetrahydrodipicolinate synthase